MTTVIKNRWDGGHAEDIRSTALDECQYSYNFDVFTNPHKLIPYPDSVAETVQTYAMSDIQISDIDISSIAGVYTLTALGKETDVSTKLTFYTKSAITNGGVLNWNSVAIAATGAFVRGSGFIYKNQAYGISTNTLFRFDTPSTATSIGTFASTVRPFIHPEEQVVYGISGTTIYRYDGSSITSTAALIPTGMTVKSITDYGTYLAIAMTPDRGNGNSITYLWSRDMTVTTFQGSIDFGEGNLVVVENLNNNLFAVMTPQNTLFTAFVNKVEIRRYSGGSVTTEKSLIISSSQSVSVAKQKNGNKLYFGLGGDYATYVFGMNKAGKYILTQDRYFNNGTIIGSGLLVINMIGDVMWKGFSTFASAYVLMRSKINALTENYTYSSTSIHRTTINPNMIVSDRQLNKELISVKIAYTGKTNGTIGIKYSVDGTSDVAILSETTTATEEVKNTTAQVDEDSFLNGKEFVFQLETTGGVEIKELKYVYNVIEEVA